MPVRGKNMLRVLIAATLLAACQTAPVRGQASLEAGAPATPTQGEQWLYGSAEGALASQQTWAMIVDFAEGAAARRPINSVVLDPKSDASAPKFLPCGAKPLAAVFDADETLLWNLGAMEYFSRKGVGFSLPTWLAFERTGAGKAVATPGALDALARLRDKGITVVVNTNRTALNAKGTIDTLRAAGLGEFVHGQTLYLMGDELSTSGKDGRRAKISETYCVVLLAGDQLGDIADRFNDKALDPRARKTLATAPAYANLWGRGWFILPNPVYGPSIKGSFEDVFPAETRWRAPPDENS